MMSAGGCEWSVVVAMAIARAINSGKKSLFMVSPSLCCVSYVEEFECLHTLDLVLSPYQSCRLLARYPLQPRKHARSESQRYAADDESVHRTLVFHLLVVASGSEPDHCA